MVVSLRILTILLSLLMPLLGHGATFTPDESDAAQVVGRASVIKSMKAHRDHLEKTGIGLFYGMKSDYSPTKQKSATSKIKTDLDRFSFVKSSLKQDFINKLGSVNSVDSYVGSLVGIQDDETRYGDLQMTGSVLWPLKHVIAAYVAANKKERSEQIGRIVRDSGYSAQTLMLELQKDGWHSIYWNPDVNEPNDSDPAKRAHHLRTYQDANNGTYMNNSLKVDYVLLNYRPSPGSQTKKDVSSLRKLKRVPFWVGMANFGKHAFVGYQDHVTEAHNIALPTNPKLIMDENFISWKGHYKTEKLLSGIIMVPPGSL